MSEEKFDHLEKMMELVLKEIIVVKSNMATKDDVAGLDAKIDAVDAKLTAKIDAVDAKLAAKIDAVDAKLAAKIDAVDAKLTAKIDTVDAKLTAKIDAVDAKLTDKIDAVDAKLAAKIDAVDAKLTAKIDALDSKVECYGQAQQEDVYGLLKVMDKKLTDLSEDIKSVAEVTGEHEIRIRTLTRRPV